MFLLPKEYVFPPVHFASEDGILALGGDLHPNRLLIAYRMGIFPWYNAGEPIVWYCPHERMVLKPQEVYISKSMKKLIQKNSFNITYNAAFEKVIHQCQTILRPEQESTWINDDYKKSMLTLHQQGFAKSVEVWSENKLVGGLYGVDLGNVFTGESMFSILPNTSKMAFIYLCKKLEKEKYALLDCQVYSEHLESLGAYLISQDEFIEYLKK